METNGTKLFAHRNVRALVVLVLIAVIVALGAYAYTTVKQARYAGYGPNIISVQGEGEVFAIPDLATFSFSVMADGEDAPTAQEQSAQAINEILSYLEGEGIEDRDIRTIGYNLNPKYEYDNTPCPAFGRCPVREPELVGYEVVQTIEVKVRDTERAGALISGAGERGATNVSGLNFTIDDTDALVAEAREKAISEAKAKAEALAENLGVRLVRMTGFWEEVPPMYPYYDGYGRAEMAMDQAMSTGAAPGVPGGENTITSRVNISYEIR